MTLYTFWLNVHIVYFLIFFSEVCDIYMLALIFLLYVSLAKVYMSLYPLLREVTKFMHS